MTKAEARRQFAEMVARDEDEIELDRAALLIAAEEYPHLEIGKYLTQLDLFARQARQRQGSQVDSYERVLGLSEYLFGELGFKGNAEEYYDARNSFLSDVIDRRTGIPITLSVLYIEVARRIGWSIAGVGLPGHFLVKYCDGVEEILIDPFHGGRILSVEDCRNLIEEIYGGRLSFQPSFLNTVTKKQILTRMLQNLKGIYARAADYHRTLAVIERVLLLNPESPAELRDHGLVCLGLGRYAQALIELETYLRRQPQAEDADVIKERIKEIRRRQVQLN